MKALVIECKRLGKNTPSGWPLIKNYTNHGILRFQSEDWRYGNHTNEGIMIAFVQDMQLETIIKEVNNQLTDLDGVETLSVNGLLNENSISRLSHSINRTFPITPFLLKHVWADLRQCYG